MNKFMQGIFGLLLFASVDAAGRLPGEGSGLGEEPANDSAYEPLPEHTHQEVRMGGSDCCDVFVCMYCCPVVCPVVAAGTMAAYPYVAYRVYYKPNEGYPMARWFAENANPGLLELVDFSCKIGQGVCCLCCPCTLCDKVHEEFKVLQKPMEAKITDNTERRFRDRQVTMR